MIEYRPPACPGAPDPQREKALAALEGRQGTVRELAAHAEVSDAVMRGLVNAGALERSRSTATGPFPNPIPTSRRPSSTTSSAKPPPA
jgi:primosomal protein N' (replication factor Y)